MDMMHLCRENDLKEICYCGSSVGEGGWVSEFVGDAHYKSCTCSCGNKLRIRVDFLGSGHDSWSLPIIKKENRISIRTIDNIVKLAR